MYDVVVFPFHDWKKCQSQGLVRRDTQFILGLERVSEVRRILVVDRPVSTPILVHNLLRRDNSFVHGGKLVGRMGTSWLWRLSDKLYALDTIVLEPFTTLLLQRRWWPYILKRDSFLTRVSETVQILGIENPILWLFTPLSTPAIGRFGEQLVVFDALDNWSEHERMSSYWESSREGYDDVKSKADLAFCGS